MVEGIEALDYVTEVACVVTVSSAATVTFVVAMESLVDGACYEL